MKRLSLLVAPLSFFVLPFVASAQVNFLQGGSGGSFGQALNTIILFANQYIIPFLLAIGFLVFVWGMFRYFIVGASDEEARSSGKNILIYTIVGFVLIFVFWGILNIIVTSTGLSGQQGVGVPAPVAPTIP